MSAARLETLIAKSGYDDAVTMLRNDQKKLQMLEQSSSEYAIVTAAQANLIKTEIFRLNESLKDMDRTFLPGHPQIVKPGALEQLTMAYVRGTRQQWLAAQSDRRCSNHLICSIGRRGAGRSGGRRQLTADYNRIEKDLDVIDGRIKEVSLNQDAGALNISVLEAAHPAMAASHPEKKKILLMALAVGVLAGASIAVVREKLRPVALAGKAGAESGLPVLGVLPAMPVGTSSNRALQTHLEPVGEVAEAVRSMARSLSHYGLDDNRGRTLLVTSLQPLEGHSTLSANLATAMAQVGCGCCWSMPTAGPLACTTRLELKMNLDCLTFKRNDSSRRRDIIHVG